MSNPHTILVIAIVLAALGCLSWICERLVHDTCFKVRDFIVAQLRDGATWRGVALVASGLGAKMQPEHFEGIIIAGVLTAGILAIIWPPKNK